MCDSMREHLHIVVLDAATTIGILVCFIKVLTGAEPHQEKLIKSKLESITLWLSYSNPLKYYRRVINRTLFNLAAICFGVITFPLYRTFILRLGP